MTAPTPSLVTDEMVERARTAWLKHASDYCRLDVSIRAALEAALDGMVVQGWQPIESAPKDGTEILATGGGLRDGIETVSYDNHVGCWNASACTLDDHDDDPSGYSRPKHWMPKPSLPLPATPQAPQGE